jgi:signal transduction histidine kinase
MTALRLALERVAAGTRQDDIRAQLALLLEAVGRADRSLHRISAGLRPATLDLGIVPAVRQFLDDWSALAGVAVSLRADDLPDQWLAPDVETQLFRILQEALTNVGKHSGARQVSVEIERTNSGVSLAVTDDGCGFDVAAAAATAARTGLGLIGIRERVQLVGGRLAITASEGQGTTVSVAIPRTPAAADL